MVTFYKILSLKVSIKSHQYYFIAACKWYDVDFNLNFFLLRINYDILYKLNNTLRYYASFYLASLISIVIKKREGLTPFRQTVRIQFLIFEYYYFWKLIFALFKHKSAVIKCDKKYYWEIVVQSKLRTNCIIHLQHAYVIFDAKRLNNYHTFLSTTVRMHAMT